MADIIDPLDKISNYKDSQESRDRGTQLKLLQQSATLYVGNLSFYSTEEQIYQLFSNAQIQKMEAASNVSLWALTETAGMSLLILSPSEPDPLSRTPCGFCFVEYYSHAEALACMRYINGTKLDERIIRCDLDTGYKDGRQFGRGRSGGQVCLDF
jgi:nuclear cap-binding protein subunit 2